jgi:hypothetical protein
MFDELKNQWSLCGFGAKPRATSEPAARLLLVVLNLWTLFVRFIKPQNIPKQNATADGFY